MTSRKVNNNGTPDYWAKVTTITEDNHPVDIQHVVLDDGTGTAITTLDTELPDATLLADGDAIPTAPKVGAVMMAKNTSGTLDIAKLAKAHDMDTGAGEEYGTGVSLRFAASGGSVANTVSDTIDSRVGLDIQHSSIAFRTLADFNSIDGALGANAYQIFSPSGSRGSYYDLDGLGNILVNCVENTGGGAVGVLYAIWSNDGTRTANNDPGDGSGFTNYSVIWSSADSNPLVGKLIPRGGRYAYFVYQNSAFPQGTGTYQHCEINIQAVPLGFTSKVVVDNARLQVVGDPDVPTAAGQPVIIGGVDNVGSPTQLSSLAVNTSGAASVIGTSTNFASGSSLLSAERMGSSATVSSVAEATSSTQLAASNTARRGFTVHNDTANVLKLKFGTAASATSYTAYIAAGASWTMPLPLYSGVIHGISTGTGGNWRVTIW